jgi:S-DNA-T family DNA segregation ATPase FtsK/SpoIIIE
VLELEAEQLSGGTETYSTQVIWKFSPNSVSSEFTEDWSRLAEHPLVFCRAVRELMSGKGRYQTVDLANVKTFVPSYDKDRGSFVSVYKKQNDIALTWRANLVQAKDLGLLVGSVADDLEQKFNAFETSYTAAIRGFAENGLIDTAIKQQLQDYAELLDAICRRAKGDRNRELLLRPLLQVGTVIIDGGKPTVVVAPWHPLRITAMCRRAELVAGLISHLLTAEQVFFGDTRLFWESAYKRDAGRRGNGMHLGQSIVTELRTGQAGFLLRVVFQ